LPRYAGRLIARFDFRVWFSDVSAKFIVHQSTDFLDATGFRYLLSRATTCRAFLPVDEIPRELGFAGSSLLQS